MKMAKSNNNSKFEINVYIQGQETVREIFEKDCDGRNGQEIKIKAFTPDVIYKSFVVKNLDDARRKIVDIINYRRAEKIDSITFESTDAQINHFGKHFEIVDGIEVNIPVADRKRLYKNLIRSKAMDQDVKKLTKIEILKI